MDIAQKIEKILTDALEITSIEVINESHKHIGHAGDNGTGQTHFKLLIVSPDFEDVPRVARQKRILSLLSGLFDEGLHALSIKATS